MQMIINLPGFNITSVCFNSVLKLIAWSQGYKDMEIAVNNAGGSHVGWVRERLMGWKNIEEVCADDRTLFGGQWPNYDYILWIDSDIQFTVENFLQLMDDDQDIVSGYYKIADGGDKSCVLEVSDKPHIEKSYMTIPELEARIPEGKLIDCEHVGFGFVLIKKGVFENTPKPYFMDQRIERDGQVVSYTGEDVAFCNRTRQSGYKIYVDPRVRVMHCKTFLI